MIDRLDAESALGEVRSLLSADGGDIVVVGVADDRIELRLILETAECAECVMPREFLESIALDMMRSSLPDLVTVSISDPRES